MEFEYINRNLLLALRYEYPEQCDEVFSQDMCDIDGSFLGFVDTYYHLSKIIPKDWIVIDFGCAYNPQAYFFRSHKKFVAVDIDKCKKFKFENTEIHEDGLVKYIQHNPNNFKVFAICNNVPTDKVDLIRSHYKDMFIFYTKQ